MTFSQIETGIAQVAADIVAESNRVASGTGQLTLASTNLAKFPVKYGELVTAINAYAAANPDQELAKVVKQKMDTFVAEFVALQTRADALVAAVNGVQA